MNSRSRQLATRAEEVFHAAVAAYNRPRDPYRIEQFAILICNGWELLLKGRILQLNKNKLASIAVYETRRLSDGSPGKKKVRKRSRCGNTMTIGLMQAFDRLSQDNADRPPMVVRENLEAVIEIRDTAVHFLHMSSPLSQETHEVFSASALNFLMLLGQWFGLASESHQASFVPLAFIRGDVQLNARGSELRLIRYLRDAKAAPAASEDARFHFAVRVVVEAKKSNSNDAVSYRLTKDPSAQPLRLEEADIRDRFPLTYEQVIKRCKDRYSDFLQNDKFRAAMKDIKADPTLHNRRLLDPSKPNGGGKGFYSPNLLPRFDKLWTRKSETTLVA